MLVCGRCKATVVDVVTTYLYDWKILCPSGRWRATLGMADVITIVADGIATYKGMLLIMADVIAFVIYGIALGQLFIIFYFIYLFYFFKF